MYNLNHTLLVLLLANLTCLMSKLTDLFCVDSYLALSHKTDTQKYDLQSGTKVVGPRASLSFVSYSNSFTTLKLFVFVFVIVIFSVDCVDGIVIINSCLKTKSPFPTFSILHLIVESMRPCRNGAN